MDVTIVVSVLAALLLWPIAMALVGAVTFLTVGTVLRGRLSGLKGPMATCRQMLQGSQGSGAGPCAGAATARSTES